MVLQGQIRVGAGEKITVTGADGRSYYWHNIEDRELLLLPPPGGSEHLGPMLWAIEHGDAKDD